MSENIIEPFGMYNSGVICYFNSAMQSLMSSRHFIKFVEQSNCVLSKEIVKHYTSRDSYNLNVFNAFMEKSPCKTFGFGQEDSGEFIVFLLEAMQDNPFLYEYKCDLFCMQCRKSKQVSPDKNMFFYTSPSHIKNNTISGEGLSGYIKNNYSKCYGIECGHCGSGRLAKTNRISSVSELLFISIQPDTDKKELCKYPSYITFECDKDLHVYRLISVIFHSGNKESGHYYARCLRGSKWYEFNDLSVKETEYPLPEENAYILLYDYIRTDADAALS